MNIEFLTNLGLSEETASVILDEVKLLLEEEFSRGEKEGLSQLDKYKFDEAVENELIKTKAKNPELLKSLLDFDSVLYEDGEFLGLTEQLDRLKEENPFLFEEEGTAPKFSRKAKGDDHITKKDFDAMPYAQRVSLFSKNPALYNELKG
ncbi:MAG: phage scaffolding protein [Clostridia bacterium]|nr:phage scaffolding protein [Clostridia bacterium]